MRGSRGDTWESGSIRTQQVWVGKRHDRIQQSRYVPPPPGDLLQQGIYDWEKWIHAESDIPLIVKIALAHYQFETLHPFHDGNGRLGRLIAVLQLLEAEHLSHPLLALSPWFEARKDAYTDLLFQTSTTGDFEQWIAFFVQAVLAQANGSALRARRLLSLREAFVAELREQGIKGAAVAIAEDLVVSPVLTIGTAKQTAGVSWQGAKNAVERLVAAGVIDEIGKSGKTRLFSAPRVLDALTSDDRE
jgi:Fic family protein